MKKLMFGGLTLGVMVVLAGCNSGAPSAQLETQGEVVSEVVADQKPIEKTGFQFEETEFDFGMIKQSGGKVSHAFKFKYYGDPIKVTGVPASCECTSAEISKSEFKNGDEGTLKVVFNPNLHGEPDGRFFKTVSILTEPKLEEMPEVKIWTEIDLDLGEEAFELQKPHDD